MTRCVSAYFVLISKPCIVDIRSVFGRTGWLVTILPNEEIYQIVKGIMSIMHLKCRYHRSAARRQLPDFTQYFTNDVFVLAD